MHLVTCRLKPLGDQYNILALGFGPPGITFPETFVLAAMHGPGSVYDIEVVGETESTPTEEFARLHARYGDIVHQLFPGVNPQIPMEMPAPKATGKKGVKPQVDEP